MSRRRRRRAPARARLDLAPPAWPRRPRDAQRQRCYDAEAALGPAEQGRPLPTVTALQAWVDTALAREPDAPLAVVVGTGSGSRRARATWSPGTGHRLQVPRHARTELVACHELAHVLVTHRYGLDGAAAHGWQWAAIYLDLVERHIGPRAAAALRARFAAHRVRFLPPEAATG